MSETKEGRYILSKRPRVNHDTINLAELQKLPSNSFGYLFQKHMVDNGFDKGIQEPPRSPFESPNTAYAKARWRETHDFRHVLTGMPPKLADETIIAAFQYGNHKNTWSLLVMIIAPLFTWKPISPLKQWLSMYEAYKAGKDATCLASVAYETEFKTPIEQLRKKWNVKSLAHLSTSKH